jgi:formate hydrogenlyase subunit 3/multisubunit Na+/H+ antiporter MnhD subunit
MVEMGILNKVRASIGYWMERIGLLGLPMGVGALIGFYMADQEMRLVPDFLSIILVALCFCLLAIVLGRLFAKKLYRETQQQTKVRKRVIACIVAILLLAGFKLVLFWAEQPSRLTDLTPSEFNKTFAYNSELFKELDKGLENAVRHLFSKPEIFNAQHVLTASEEQILQQHLGHGLCPGPNPVFL